MSFSDKGQKCEAFFHKSSDSEENCCIDEEAVSEESLSDSITKLKNITIGKNHKNSRIKKQTVKSRSHRLNVSLRYRKSNRHSRQKNKSQKIIEKNSAGKLFLKDNFSEKPIETPIRGKRCHCKGKAKGKPPEEKDQSNADKHDSDDESDNCYIGRISLGYFQKFRDKSGASTSNQWEEDDENHSLLHDNEEKWDKVFEDKELLELQRWGMTAFSSFSKENIKLSRTDNHHPDTL